MFEKFGRVLLFPESNKNFEKKNLPCHKQIHMYVLLYKSHIFATQKNFPIMNKIQIFYKKCFFSMITYSYIL